MGNGKKIFICILSLLFCNYSNPGSVVLNAAKENIVDNNSKSGSITGYGSVEGYASNDIIRVVLPAVSLDYILDPQGVIKSTNGIAYKTAKFDYCVDGIEKNDGFVFFPKMVGTQKEYSSTLDLSFVNKSSCPVIVKVTASFESGQSGISLKNSSNFDGSSDAISVNLSDENQNALITDSSYEFQKSLYGVQYAYTVNYSASNGYYYEYNEKNLGDTILDKYDLKLVACCDPESDWSQSDPSKSLLTLTWNIKKDTKSENRLPTIINIDGSVDSKNLTDVKLYLEYGTYSNATVDSLWYKTGTGRESKLATSAYSVEDNVITIKASAFKQLKKGTYTYKVKFSNSSSSIAQIEII